MKIRYLGHSCFELTSKSGVKIITDPYTGVGYELPCPLVADIITVSHCHFDHNYTQAVSGGYIVSDLGITEVNGVKIEGIASFHDDKNGALRGKNIVYKIIVDGMVVCHLGDLGEPCNPALVGKIGEVDVLLLPIGGTYTIDAIGAKAYVDALQPKMVIPMHYKPSDGALDIDGVQNFLSLCPKDKIISAIDGEAEIDETRCGVLYMERVKM